jgi:antitoxin HicB
MSEREPLEHYLELQYPFRVEADPDGGYVISFPDLPGCLTQAETADEIGPMAEEARQLWIETEYAEGEPIPAPSYPEEYSGRFNVRLPKSLHRRLVEAAEREGVSLNQYVVATLARGEAEARTSGAADAGGQRPLRSVAEGRDAYRTGSE